MIQFDAQRPRKTVEQTGLHPHLRGYRVTDLSAVVGAFTWLVAAAGAVAWTVELTVVELFVAFAVLVLLPLGLGQAATPRASKQGLLPYRVAVLGQYPAALTVVAALTFPVESIPSMVLVVPWLGITGLIALVGLWRLRSRGLLPLSELAIDAALLYVPVGAVALLLHRAGISFHFKSVIILLTVVHYHYAGFVLPLVTGLANREMTAANGRFSSTLTGRLAALATLVIIVNLALIAVGITFSPLLEVIAVTLFTVAVGVFAVLVVGRVVPELDRGPAALLGVASLSIFGTMVLALAYGYSAFPATGRLITIGEMIRWHGTLNAFGFALPALLAFRFDSS